MKKFISICILSFILGMTYQYAKTVRIYQPDFIMQLPMQSDIYFLQITPDQIRSHMQNAVREMIKQNMPEIEVSQDSIVEVKIHNAEEYRAFVCCLEKYRNYGVLWLNLAETDTVVYLDEILAYHNFEILTIQYGGTISVRNMENLNANPLRNIEMYHPCAIEENLLSQMSNLQDVVICFDSRYTGVLPAKELLQNTDCRKIVMIWDEEQKEKVNLEGLVEWDEINAMMPEKERYLKALYVCNEDDYNYISYEFCGRGEKICDAFICIKDRESSGKKYFDILEVPIENADDISWLTGRRVRLEDVNFDGYRDLIFVGYNELMGYRIRCIGFLWNEMEQKYEWNATVPKHYDGIDEERKRIIYMGSLSAFDENYRIYEYNGSIFTEKRLTVKWSEEVQYPGYRVTWKYYEDGGEMLKKLEQSYNEEKKLYYITYEENGIVTEKVMEEADYDNRYNSERDLGQEYFPEFDFYMVG